MHSRSDGTDLNNTEAKKKKTIRYNPCSFNGIVWQKIPQTEIYFFVCPQRIDTFVYIFIYCL